MGSTWSESTGPGFARAVFNLPTNACYIYGARVLAPCAGEVVSAIDGLPELPIPETDQVHVAGNHVVLQCVNVDVLLGQLRPGSVVVPVGPGLGVGDAIAVVGNARQQRQATPTDSCPKKWNGPRALVRRATADASQCAPSRAQ